MYAEPFQNTPGNPDADGTEYACTYEESKKLSEGENYAEVQSVNEEYEYIEEEYDITHDRRNERQLKSKNNYAVLNVRSSKPNGAQPDEYTSDVYDTTEDNKDKAVPNPNKDYDVFTSNKGNNHETDTTYDVTFPDDKKKMLPVTNDYDEFCINNK